MAINALCSMQSLYLCSGAACGILGTGGAIAAAGYGLQSDRLIEIGKYTSYTVLVPTYIVCYQFPKWAITEGIPKAASLFERYILTPALKKLYQLAEKSVEWIQYIGQHILEPVVRKVVNFMHDYLYVSFTKICKWLWERSEAFCIFTRDKILIPCWEAAVKVIKWVANNVWSRLCRVAEWCGERVIRVLEFARDKLLMPCWNAVVKVTNWVLEKVLPKIVEAVQWLGERVVRVLEFARDKLLVPCWNAVAKVTNWVLEKVLPKIVEAVQWCGVRIMDVITFSIDNVLIPLMSKAHVLMSFIVERVLTPLWAQVIKMAELANDYILEPLFKAAQYAGLQGYNIMAAVAESISNAVVGIGSTAGRIFDVISKDVIHFFYGAGATT